MFQVPLGIFKNPAMPYMRVGSYLPITVVLALVFVIPHDSSTRLDPDVVGAAGYTMMPSSAAAWSSATPSSRSSAQRKSSFAPHASQHARPPWGVCRGR